MSIFAALLFVWLGHFLVDFMLGIWSVHKTMVHMDLALAGSIAAGCALLGEGSQIYFGNLGDRGYRKILIALGIALTACNALLAFSNQYFFVISFFMLACIGSGAFHPSAAAFLGSLTENKKGLFISIFASGGYLGMALSQMIYSQTHTYFEGNTLPLVLPVVILLLILIPFGFFKREIVSQEASSHPFGFKLIREYFQDRSLKMLYITQVCNQMIVWGTIFLLPDVLVSRGYDLEIAYGGGNLAFLLGNVLTVIPSGYLADRWSNRGMIFTCTFIGMFFYFAFLSMPTLSTQALLVCLGGAGAMLGIVQPIAVALGNDLRKKNPGMASAFAMGLVWCVSETCGPLGLGVLSELFTEDAPAKALLVYGIFFPLTLYAALQLPARGEESLAIAEINNIE